jgi:DNA-binding transcriptional MerR regulator
VLCYIHVAGGVFLVEQDLISKKDLLELTGISYGQLYRWKRKSLIPEDWFIRKSTFTGQETFFPKEKILARIDQIKNMKDGLSLDELADMFSPSPSEVSVRPDEFAKQNIVTKTTFDVYTGFHQNLKVFSFENLLCMYALDTLLQTGDINLEEGKILIQAFEEHYAKFPNRHCELIFVRKLGIATCMLVSTPCELYFESGTKIVAKLHMPACVEQLKLKLS